MTGFALTAPAQTVFGRGCRAQAAGLIRHMGRRVLLVRGRSVPWVDALAADLGTVETLVATGEPTLDDLRRGLEVARAFGADVVVAVGGGAAIDLGKALAGLIPSAGDPADYLGLGLPEPRRLNDPLPLVAIPTTAGTGAEATRNAVIGIPEEARKLSLRDARLVPDLALVDPALTDGAPAAVTLASGLDAITQLVESYLSCRANPVTDALAMAEIAPAARALAVLADQDDPKARDTMARAAYLSGLALANSGLGIVHGLASVIGGRGGAHGAICGRLLGSALAVNRQAMEGRGVDVARFDAVDGWLARAFGTAGQGGCDALRGFLTERNFPRLADLNVTTEDIPGLAEQARHASSTKANPVELSTDQIQQILVAEL